MTSHQGLATARAGGRGPTTVVMVYPTTRGYSGQAAASRLIASHLAPERFQVEVVELSAFERTAPSRLFEALRVLLQTLCAWWRLVGVLRALPERAVLYLNYPQSWNGLLRTGFPHFATLLFRPNTPVVASLHGSLFVSWPPNDARRRAFTAVLRRCNCVTVLGQHQAQVLANWGIDPGRVRVVSNSVELLPIGPSDFEKKQSYGPWSGAPIRLLHLSSLMEEKGFPEFLDMLEVLADEKSGLFFDAVLCGPVALSSYSRRFRTAAEMEQWISERIDGLNQRTHLSIRWIPGASGEEKRRLFELAHIFVFPSRYPVEAQPLVLLEAMASGCAIVASDVGEVRETLQGTGCLLPLADLTPRRLADEVLWLASNEGVLRSSAARGLSLFDERYAIPAHLGTWEALFDGLVPAGGR